MNNELNQDPQKQAVERLRAASQQVGTGVVVGRDTFPVPWWAIVLAVIGFVCMQYLFHVVIPTHRDAPPLAMRVFLGLLTGAVLAGWALLVGYVNQDAGRRGMNRTLWTLVCIFVPNGIGFILYFLMRKPLATICPQCSNAVPADANFCPRCAYRLTPVCPKCGHTVRPGDAYCANCAAPLEGNAK